MKSYLIFSSSFFINIWYDMIFSLFLIKWWWIIFVIIVISPYIDWIGIKFVVVVVVVFSLSLEYERPIDERNERTNETDFSNIYLRIFFDLIFRFFFRFSFVLVVVSWNSSIFMYLRGCCFSVFVFVFRFVFFSPLLLLREFLLLFFCFASSFFLFSNIIVVQIWVEFSCFRSDR